MAVKIYWVVFPLQEEMMELKYQECPFPETRKEFKEVKRYYSPQNR